MHWCFAKVNNHLAEVHFEPGKNLKILGHCYVKAAEYKTKKEQKWIFEDTRHLSLIYRKGKYTRLN